MRKLKILVVTLTMTRLFAAPAFVQVSVSTGGLLGSTELEAGNLTFSLQQESKALRPCEKITEREREIRLEAISSSGAAIPHAGSIVMTYAVGA